MKKKIIKIIIAILVLILLSIIGYEIYIQYDGILDKINPMSREEVIELLDKGANCNNYSIIYKSGAYVGNHKEILETQLYVKDNISKSLLNGKEFAWIDYDANERIQFWNFPTITVSNEIDYDDPRSVEAHENRQGGNYSVICKTEEYDFEYLGKKKIEGRDTIVIKSSYKKDKEKGLFKEEFAKTYIDKETGVIVGNEGFFYRGIILTRFKENMTVKFDCVTDEDVSKPNIAGYVVRDFRNQ